VFRAARREARGAGCVSAGGEVVQAVSGAFLFSIVDLAVGRGMCWRGKERIEKGLG
jgi:hypothetical protein